MIYGYRACVSWVDELVGRLLDELERSGKADHTIIVLWGDHGFHLGDHGLWGKHTAFENAMRVPLIIVDPRREGSGKTTSPAKFTDVFPTLCELAGLDTPVQWQGRSLVPVLKDANLKTRKGAIGMYKSKGAYGYSVRTERYRYIEWINTKTAKVVGRDLFDLKKDPLGKRNFADSPEYSSVLEEVTDILYEDSLGWKLLERSLDKFGR